MNTFVIANKKTLFIAKICFFIVLMSACTSVPASYENCFCNPRPYRPRLKEITQHLDVDILQAKKRKTLSQVIVSENKNQVFGFQSIDSEIDIKPFLVGKNNSKSYGVLHLDTGAFQAIQFNEEKINSEAFVDFFWMDDENILFISETSPNTISYTKLNTKTSGAEIFHQEKSIKSKYLYQNGFFVLSTEDSIIQMNLNHGHAAEKKFDLVSGVAIKAFLDIAPDGHAILFSTLNSDEQMTALFNLPKETLSPQQQAIYELDFYTSTIKRHTLSKPLFNENNYKALYTPDAEKFLLLLRQFSSVSQLDKYNPQTQALDYSEIIQLESKENGFSTREPNYFPEIIARHGPNSFYAIESKFRGRIRFFFKQGNKLNIFDLSQRGTYLGTNARGSIFWLEENTGHLYLKTFRGNSIQIIHVWRNAEVLHQDTLKNRAKYTWFEIEQNESIKSIIVDLAHENYIEAQNTPFEVSDIDPQDLSENEWNAIRSYASPCRERCGLSLLN